MNNTISHLRRSGKNKIEIMKMVLEDTSLQKEWLETEPNSHFRNSKQILQTIKEIEVIKSLENKNEQKIVELIETLGNMKNKIVLDYLFDLFKTFNKESIQRKMLEAIEKINSKEAIPELLKIIENPGYIYDSYIPNWAMITLGKIGSTEAGPLIMKYIYKCHSEGQRSSYYMSYLISALRRSKYEESIPLLVRLVNEYGFSDDGDSISHTLSYMNPKKVIPLLLEELKNETNVLMYYIFAIRDHIEKNVLPFLVEFIENPDPDVRWAIAYVLEGFKSEESFKILSEILINDSEPEVREKAFSSIIEIKENDEHFDLKHFLETMLNDKDEEVRFKAVSFLLRRKLTAKKQKYLPIFFSILKETINFNILNSAKEILFRSGIKIENQEYLDILKEAYKKLKWTPSAEKMREKISSEHIGLDCFGCYY